MDCSRAGVLRSWFVACVDAGLGARGVSSEMSFGSRASPNMAVGLDVIDSCYSSLKVS